MTRGELIYNYPLYSIKRFFTFIKYCKPIAHKLSLEGGGNFFTAMLDMIWCNLRYGAMDSRDYWLFEFYRKSASERNAFFTKRRYFRLIKHFDKKTFVQMCEKDFMYKEYKDFIKRDWMLVNEDTPENSVKVFIEKHKSAFVKPVSSEQGNGICKIKESDKEKIQELYSKRDKFPFLLEEIVRNCDAMNQINPYSLNTLRVYTIVPKGESAKVVSVSLRCGCGDVAVDNWGAGGVGYPVDIELGIICTYGKNKKGQSFAIHPGTKTQMIGMKIPYFKEALQLAVDCTMHNPKVLYAGVDVALTPNGPELIELNFPGGHDFLQTLEKKKKNAIMQTIVGK